MSETQAERSGTSHAEALTVSHLQVDIGRTRLLDDLSFSVAPGERVGLIGGSGSGKTLTALAIMGLLPRRAVVRGSIQIASSGDESTSAESKSDESTSNESTSAESTSAESTSAEVEGASGAEPTELLALPERKLARLRGDRMGMVFQEPKTALSPYRTLGRQMTHALTRHYALSRAERREAAERLAIEVGLEDVERIIDAYPHEVSGGQRQRVAIAAALSANPGLLLADEPTTALDVAVQRGVLRLLRELAGARACSLLFVTHDLAVMSEVVERVIVLDQERIVEEGPLESILRAPQHEVTRSLIRAAAESEGLR